MKWNTFQYSIYCHQKISPQNKEYNFFMLRTVTLPATLPFDNPEQRWANTVVVRAKVLSKTCAVLTEWKVLLLLPRYLLNELVVLERGMQPRGEILSEQKYLRSKEVCQLYWKLTYYCWPNLALAAKTYSSLRPCKNTLSGPHPHQCNGFLVISLYVMKYRRTCNTGNHGTIFNYILIMVCLESFQYDSPVF